VIWLEAFVIICAALSWIIWLFIGFSTRGGFAELPATTALLWTILAAVLLTGCQATLSPVDEIRIRAEFERINEVAAIPRPIPALRYNTDPNWGFAGEANCSDWSITINYELAANHPDFVINKTIPHEFGHMVSCYHSAWRGSRLCLGEEDAESIHFVPAGRTF
jgi:hypothetical protein